MMVPLVARGRILGALSLISDSADRRFDEKDLAYAAQLAQRAALSVDNAQLHARTVATAQTLQAGLLPAALPDIPGVALAARYHPVGEDSEVGGDFYDVHALETGGWAVTVGDVCGKGAEAAALTALIRYTLRVVAEDGPAEALRRLNEAILHQRPDGTFATLVHVQVTPAGEDLRLCVACAGHPAPVLRRSDGTLELIQGHGPLVGAFAGLTWPEERAVLRPGDALAIYTDGVLEAGDRPLVAEELLRLLRGAPDGADGLADRLEAVALDAPRAGRDDVAVLVLERTPPHAGERFVLGAGPDAPRRARAVLEPHLAALPAAAQEAARLLITETVTNAVRHGGLAPGDPIDVHVRHMGTRLRVEVRDGGRGMREVPPKPPPGATGGYGLHLVEELSDRWGWSSGIGTCVWFELEGVADPEGSRPATAA
jgi:serine phosphatase RsbU (regulator of sigma subunit)/anti-sigma regulatory factor (Ser/Thr protein kinase)